jgi:hypothetical protein
MYVHRGKDVAPLAEGRTRFTESHVEKIFVFLSRHNFLTYRYGTGTLCLHARLNLCRYRYYQKFKLLGTIHESVRWPCF